MRLFWRLILAAGALATFIWLDTPPAKAGIGLSCVGPWQEFNCNLYDTGAPFAKIIAGPAASGMTDEAAARDAKWQAYCQPKFVRDKFGAERAVYAHAGCEFGRTAE